MKMRFSNYFEPSSLLLFLFIITGITVAEWKAIESPCLCQEFRCDDGTCLAAERVCNNSKDCVGGEDERNNLTTAGANGKCSRKRVKCSPTEFKCKFGGCIELSEVCDGKIHCWGSVDEASDLCAWVHSP